MRGNFYLLLFSLSIGGMVFAQPNPFTCIWQCTGNSPNSRFGWQLVSAGDMNDDGYDDIIASSWEDSVVYLYFGGNPMDTIPDIIFNVPHDAEFGLLPKECRDVNGDGYPDIAIQSHRYTIPYGFMYMYFGGPEMDAEPDLIFSGDSTGSFNGTYGHNSSMGDFNGDGFYDLVIGNDSYWPPLDLGNGKIYVYYGSPDIDITPDWTVTGYYNNYGSLGNYISCSGDVNNDGYNDIINRGDSDSNGQGVILFQGGFQPDTIVDWEIQSENYFVDGGLSIIPDFNDDSFDEIIYGNVSNAIVFFGGVNMDDSVDVCLNGFGWIVHSTASIGDINNDGVISTIHRYDINNDGYNDFATATGYGYNIYLMNSSLMGEVNYDYWVPLNEMRSIKYAGDVNGDGIDEFMVSTVYNLSGLGYDWQGQVFIYSDTSLSSVRPEYTLSLPQFELQQNYPNPFNYQTIVPFQVNRPCDINIAVYDILGQKVIDLVDGRFSSGNHQVIWEAEGFTSGTYFLQLQSNGQSVTRKVTLIK